MASLIGANAHELRISAGLTLDQVSVAARARGLKWSESRVADFEAGRVAPNLGTLVAICLALADAGCPEATLPRLVKYVVPIQINDSLELWDFDLINLMSGRPVEEPEPAEPELGNSVDSFTKITTPYERKLAHRLSVDLPKLVRVWRASGATEERMRKALGISSMLLAVLSTKLWETTFSKERDRRAGDNANAQRRGQITRQMRKELQHAIAENTGGRQRKRSDGDDQ